MDTARIRTWTRTLYALIQALNLAKSVNFGRLEDLSQNTKEASKWVSPDCSYKSVLLDHPMGDRRVTFRRDPAEHFDEIARQIVNMLVQDLVAILDEQMTHILIKIGEEIPNYPLSKAQLLKRHLNSQYNWAYFGCVELIACRNVFTHGAGRWNIRSIEYVRGIVNPLPQEGDVLSVGFSMLFRYRKAIRTFINDIENKFNSAQPMKKARKKRRKPSPHQIRRAEKKLRRGKARRAMSHISAD